ncbi:oxidoreductase [Agrobacterium rhizogenes]|nr:oxidoreductase [Rhizobium rhizogenes]NTI92705.1 oxidoreductase [Rhizobium rhizogenes]NTJ55172.1 oxidoreductase [Rhizobium rhizogenes]OCJ26855.1 short-chain dehydrogenase/reductase [Agrobacterium sp. B133/95]
MSDTKSDAKTLFITGVSTGFGRALAEAALVGGHKVVGTLRRQVDRVEFEALKPGSAFGKLLDVTDTAALAPVVAEVEKEIGAIDVLVNNAGYGHEGLLEESTIDDLRRQFEVNVFGPVALIQAVLPYMRKRRAGHILNITSMGGIVTFPGLSVYHGSKFALEGISESLGKEVKSLGIHVTAVEPGGFRTDWAGRSMVRAERSISDYDEIFEPWRQRRLERSCKQPGDPKKAAQVMLQLIASENPPTHLLLGRDAISLVREKLGLLKTEFDAWEQVSASTDFE